MGTEAAIRRKASVFSNFGDFSLVEIPAEIRPIMFDSLFSGIYGEENNCMSGIAMFTLEACNERNSNKGRGICHY
jgi:hypothetical protein